MSIDIPTMLVAVLVAYALLVLDLAVVHRSLLSRQPELRLWTAGSLILLLAFLSIALRPLLAPAPAIFITNELMTFGCLIYAVATHRFVRGTALPRWHVASWLAGLVLLAGALALRLPYAQLAAGASLWLAWHLMPIPVITFRFGWHGERALRAMALTGAVCVTALLARGGHALARPDLYGGLLQPGLFQGLTFLTAFICIFGAGFGFLLANFERVANRMEQLARIDALTGCLNRGALELSLDQVAERCRRDQAACALVLMDLDHFKQINDRHGHRVGDDVLRHFADAVRQRLRPSDLFGRMGGEEFCVVLPATDRVTAHALVECLRGAVEQLAVGGLDGQSDAIVRVTVSAGVAVSDPGAPLLTIDQLYGQADERLYRAKRLGRNRVLAD